MLVNINQRKLYLTLVANDFFVSLLSVEKNEIALANILKRISKIFKRISNGESPSRIDFIFTHQPSQSKSFKVSSSLQLGQILTKKNDSGTIIFLVKIWPWYFYSPYQRLLGYTFWENVSRDKILRQAGLNFNKMVLNKFLNFVPNKIVTCNDKDRFWIDGWIKIKSKIKLKIQLYKIYIENDRNKIEFSNLKSNNKKN